MLDKSLPDNEDPSWQMHMQTLMKRKRSMEIAQTIDDALFECGIRPQVETEERPRLVD